jgi:hypothetical protein
LAAWHRLDTRKQKTGRHLMPVKAGGASYGFHEWSLCFLADAPSTRSGLGARPGHGRAVEVRAVLMVAHRLSTLQRTDRIVVLKDGRLVEQGTFAKLFGISGGVGGDSAAAPAQGKAFPQKNVDTVPWYTGGIPTQMPDYLLDADRFNLLVFRRKTGAGEGIRTLDPNLGKVVLYP